jgi:hypothetical protein
MQILTRIIYVDQIYVLVNYLLLNSYKKYLLNFIKSKFLTNLDKPQNNEALKKRASLH